MFAATLLSDKGPFGLDVLPTALPRSFGSLDLCFHHADGVTRANRVFQSGVMRARFPNVARGYPPEAVMINTAGGLTGGDSVTTNVTLARGAHAVVTTQAHEKIYRSVQGAAAMAANLRLEDDAALDWLPQPAILFEGARLDRQTHLELTGESRFLGVEAVIFGRTAMREVMRSGALTDYWTITRDNRLVHADRFCVDGDIADLLARPALLAGAAAMATIRYVAPDAQARLEQMRALLGDGGAASAWNGMLLARLVAADGYCLGRLLAPLLTGFLGRALPAAWHI